MRRTVALAAVVFAAGCVKEPTAVDVVPGYVTWVEWPTAVTTSQPGALRVSGYASCGYRVSFRVAVDSSGIHVVAEGRGPVFDICLASRAEYSADTLLPLPRLDPPSTGPWAEFAIWASVSAYAYSPHAERLLGSISLRATADTATKFAGHVMLYTDSAGCWRAHPYSSLRWDEGWVFAKPVPLTGGYYSGYLSGYLAAVVPPICGEAMAIRAYTLEVNATPPWEARARSQ